MEYHAKSLAVEVRDAHTRYIVLVVLRFFTPNSVLDGSGGAFQAINFPVVRYLCQPLYTRVFVHWIARKGHAERPPIIVRIRSVTDLSSASISASGRGGVKT